MLDPDLVLSAVVSAFRSIPEVVDQLEGDPLSITGHTFSTGTEFPLAMAIYKMPSPSILVAYLDYLGGNFNGATIWKHRLEVYIRTKNAASGSVGVPGGPRACSPQHLWWLLFNKPVLGSTQHIRSISLIDPSLYPMDTPTLTHRQDEEMQDFFVAGITIPEAGDD